jgi:hypothetical protein
MIIKQEKLLVLLRKLLGCGPLNINAQDLRGGKQEPLTRGDALRRSSNADLGRHRHRDDVRPVGWMPTFGSGEASLAALRNRG